MNDHVVVVQHAIKELSLLEQVWFNPQNRQCHHGELNASQDVKKSSILKNLDIVWQHVVESNIPPSDLHLTIGTCIITNKQNAPCIVIRGKGRGAHNFTVCNKFAPFLYHLWMTYKMDILIKVDALARGAMSATNALGMPTGVHAQDPRRGGSGAHAVACAHCPKNQGEGSGGAQLGAIAARRLHTCLPLGYGGPAGSDIVKAGADACGRRKALFWLHHSRLAWVVKRGHKSTTCCR